MMSTLFSPLQVGPLTLANRIVVPPMSQYSAQADGIATPSTLADWRFPVPEW